MQNAGIKDEVKRNKKILVQAINAANFLTEECPNETGFSANDLFYGMERKTKVKSLHYVEWGRIGFVANKNSYTTKMKVRGIPMMMVGYALNHPSGTYEMYNPTTDSVIVTDSVKWKDFTRWEATSMDSTIGKLYDNKNTSPKSMSNTEVSFSDSNTSIENPIEESTLPNVETSEPTTNDVDQAVPNVAKRSTRSTGIKPMNADTNNPKVVRALRQLDTSPQYKVTGNVTPTQIFENSDEDAVAINLVFTDDVIFTYSSDGGIMGDLDDEDDLLDLYLMHTCIQSDPGEPTRWRDALEGDDREWWLQSTTSEFNNFLSRGAWKFVPLEFAKSKGKRIIPTKLVFKKKDEIDGSIRFKTRDVTLGYMMVPGVDFTERFSPVSTDEALRLQIAINLMFWYEEWITRSCDVEAAFLEADMDVEMYIEPHPAMVACGFMTEEQRKKTDIRLMKSMYGNVDAAIKFFNLFSTYVTDENGMKMYQSKSDPCVFFKLNNKNKLVLMVTITVDDCAITGRNDDIEWFMDGVEKRFNITRADVISKHLGVIYEWGETSDGRRFCKVTMDKKVESTINYYEKYIQKEAKIYSTPGAPNENLLKHEGEPIDIDEYRSLVGQIMFFTTKICPKTGAAVRALSAHMSNPGVDHWKAMGRLVGYLKGMKVRGITYYAPDSFQTVSLADTDYGNCKETRRSVGCSLITVGGCLVDWWISKHQTVSDSSCEAEYKELAKCAKGVKFVHMLLDEMNLLQLPGLIGEDNQGAIFLANNKQVSQRTKHIDIKYHFIREFIEKKNGVQQGHVFKIDTKENTSDIGTKNVEVSLFKKHEKELDTGMMKLREKAFGENGENTKAFSGGMSDSKM